MFCNNLGTVSHQFCLIRTDFYPLIGTCLMQAFHQFLQCLFFSCQPVDVVCKTEAGDVPTLGVTVPVWFYNAFIIILSKKMLKSNRDRKHPWWTPTVVQNNSPMAPFSRNALLALLYKCSVVRTRAACHILSNFLPVFSVCWAGFWALPYRGGWWDSWYNTFGNSEVCISLIVLLTVIVSMWKATDLFAKSCCRSWSACWW